MDKLPEHAVWLVNICLSRTTFRVVPSRVQAQDRHVRCMPLGMIFYRVATMGGYTRIIFFE